MFSNLDAQQSLFTTSSVLNQKSYGLANQNVKEITKRKDTYSLKPMNAGNSRKNVQSVVLNASSRQDERYMIMS